jgi:hypothetical protein
VLGVSPAAAVVYGLLGVRDCLDADLPLLRFFDDLCRPTFAGKIML